LWKTKDTIPAHFSAYGRFMQQSHSIVKILLRSLS